MNFKKIGKQETKLFKAHSNQKVKNVQYTVNKASIYVGNFIMYVFNSNIG